MDDREKDIFDRVMTLPMLEGLQPLFAARREKLLYLLFGGLSFLLSVGSYAVFQNGLSPLEANLLSWVVTVAFVYETNRRWVFKSEAKRGTGLIWQLLAFYAGRVLTLLVEEGILAVFAIALSLPGVPVKVAAQAVVILLNYIISKQLVFRERR